MTIKQEQYEMSSVVTATDVRERCYAGSTQYQEITSRFLEPLLDIILVTLLTSTDLYIQGRRNVDVLKERKITKEDLEYVRQSLQKAKVQQYPIQGYYYNTYFEIDEKGKVTIMTDSYQISGLLLAAIEQALLDNMNGYEEGSAERADVLVEVQAILRGDTDGDKEERAETEVEADSSPEGMEV